MKQYQVEGEVRMICDTIVEADNAEEAKKKFVEQIMCEGHILSYEIGGVYPVRDHMIYDSDDESIDY